MASVMPLAEPGSLATWGDFPRQLLTAREGQILICVSATTKRAQALTLNDACHVYLYECSRDMIHANEREMLMRAPE